MANASAWTAHSDCHPDRLPTRVPNSASANTRKPASPPRPPRPAAAPARKRLPKAERYEGILAAAEEVFCQLGYDAATMADVAQRAGVVEGNVYRYFKSKRELVARVVSDWYSRKISELDAEVRQIASVRSRLRYLIAAHLRSLRDSPALMRLIIRELRTGDPEFSAIVGELNQRYTAFLRLTLEDGVRSGELRESTPVRLVRDMIFGGIEHHAARYLAGSGALDVESTADQMLALILAGTGSATAAASPPASTLAKEPGSA